MNLKDCKCPNCGASLEVPENTKKIKCEYCRKTFEVESTYDSAYNHTKGVLDAQMETSKEIFEHFNNNPFNKVVRIIAAVIIIAITVMVFSIAIPTFMNSGKDDFNFFFESYPGVKSSFFVKTYINKVIESNSKNPKRQICVVLDGEEVCNNSEIPNVVSKLSSYDYSVSLGYDEKGYVNKLILNSLNK